METTLPTESGSTETSPAETRSRKQATFYHAGSETCRRIEREIVCGLDSLRYDVEIVHLGEHTVRQAEARRLGVRSLPALVINYLPYHLDFGAHLSDLA